MFAELTCKILSIVISNMVCNVMNCPFVCNSRLDVTNTRFVDVRLSWHLQQTEQVFPCSLWRLDFNVILQKFHETNAWCEGRVCPSVGPSFRPSICCIL